ncbi:hypothetical protein CsSME_00027152 [Camellia sinensis var. sinensis]
MKRCELCKLTARMFCDSDQANLCWDCDAKVHSANFLVARHSRSLLCHVCQSPTPWNASGAKLGPTVSVCEACVGGCEGVKESRAPEEESEGGNDADLDTDDEYDDDDDDGDEIEGEDDEGVSGDDVDGDNQVVPLSSTPPPPPSSSSSSEDSSSRFCNSDGAVSLKRLRVNAADLLSNDDHGCSSCHRNTSSAAVLSARDREAGFGHSLRPLKRLRDEANRSNQSAGVQLEPAGSRTAGIVESLKRLHQEDLSSGYNASAAIVGICKLSQNPGTFSVQILNFF